MEKHIRAMFLLLLLVVMGRVDSAPEVFYANLKNESTGSGNLRVASPSEGSVLVKVRGAGVCSGVPVSGTNFVITAAHCVVEKSTGHVGSRYDLRVEREGNRYDIAEVLVDWNWGPEMDSANDVAVLVMSEQVPGPKVSISDEYQVAKPSIMVGYQPLDGDGTWLRGENYDDLVHAKGSASGIVNITSTPAACTAAPGEVSRTKSMTWDFPCGMVPGASGGPVLVESGSGNYALVGVISAVNYSLTRNFIAPVDKVHALLANPEKYLKHLTQPEPSGSSIYLK